MATLNGGDLVLLNRGDVTYKGTMTLVAEFVTEVITGGGSLVLDSLGDVSTGRTGPNALDAGKFLLADGTGLYKPLAFADEVEDVIEVYLNNNPTTAQINVFGDGDIRGLGDVDQASKSYVNTFLLGQQKSDGSGTDTFKAVDFTDQVNTTITNYFGTGGPGDGKLVEELNDLSDVNYAAGISDGEILVYDGANSVFVEAELKGLVETILQLNLNVDINPSNLPIADYHDPLDASGSLGIISVAKAVNPADQILKLNNGVLDIDLPASTIPDVFVFKGNFQYDADGNSVVDNGTSTGSTAPPAAVIGDIYVALVKTPGDPGDSLTGGVPDKADSIDLNTWQDFNNRPLDVRHGSLVVCVVNGTEGEFGGTRWATLGELDYTPADQNLQMVLDEGNSATGKDILLNNGSVVLTTGNFTTTAGNISTDKGSVTTAEGDIITTIGDIIIGTKSGSTTGSVLSVPNIDFARFADISTAP